MQNSFSFVALTQTWAKLVVLGIFYFWMATWKSLGPSVTYRYSQTYLISTASTGSMYAMASRPCAHSTSLQKRRTGTGAMISVPSHRHSPQSYVLPAYAHRTIYTTSDMPRWCFPARYEKASMLLCRTWRMYSAC